MMPPMPTMGILTAFAHCHTIRTATGLIAGPDMPPVLLARAKLLRRMSIFIPVSVLIREIASAPPASAAFAISVMSVTFGLNFIITGCFAAFLILDVMSNNASAFCPNAMAPSLTFGQETLISIIAMSVSARRSTTSR